MRKRRAGVWRYRELIPLYWEARQTALMSGAIGFNISGAGPSVFAICRDEATARSVGEAIQELYREHGLKSEWLVARPRLEGAREVV